MKKLLSAAGFVLAAVLPLGVVVAQVVTAPPAATAASVSTTVDLTALAVACLPIAFGALAFFMRQLLVKLLPLLHVQNAQAVLAEWDAYAPLALASAQSKLAPLIRAKGLTVDVRNALVQEAVAFMATHATAATQSSAYDGAKLAERFEAMIALNTVPATESVALPSPTTAAIPQPAVPAAI